MTFKAGQEVWEKNGSIATILNEGQANNYSFRYIDDPGSDQYDYYVDCATAKLIWKLKETTCCKSIFGGVSRTKWRNEMEHLNGSGIPAVSRLTHLGLLQSVLDAQPPDYDTLKVFKSGCTTGPTWGRVIDVMAPHPDKNVIIIESISKVDGQTVNFAAGGDSGAALLDANYKLVGLVYKIHKTTQRAYACHIEPVLHYLNVTPVTDANPVPGSDTLEDAPSVIDDPGAGHAALLLAAFMGSAGGRLIGDILLTHRSEILDLVNTNRRVTVAWHRHKGPGFVNHLVKNVRDPDHAIPQEIDGVTREALIRTMARVLAEHGSTTLAEVTAKYLDTALEYARRFDSLHELAAGLKKEGSVSNADGTLELVLVAITDALDRLTRQLAPGTRARCSPRSRSQSPIKRRAHSSRARSSR
ncbi:hypothetical protein [Nannocystis pusilla]|uniref:hypothetical protein n=1 Tax=Nannocystis pusilla TaxID=889268 RepID=UPI003B7AFC45